MPFGRRARPASREFWPAEVAAEGGLYLPVVLEHLEREGHDFIFHVISNQPPEYTNLRYTPWRAQTEIPDLLQFSLGLMPLVDDAWAQGKCAFKAPSIYGAGSASAGFAGGDEY